jgi:hypothetical protein
MHLDPLYARRTQAGAPVVHGMHAALWALEELARNDLLAHPPARVAGTFAHFIYLDAAATLRIVRSSDTSLRVEIISAGVNTTTLDIAFGEPPEAVPPEAVPSELPPREVPWAGDFAAVAARAGTVPLETSRLAPLFPALAARIGAARVATLGRLSYVVGMLCPGLHSIFSTFSLAFVSEPPGTSGAAGLSFRVASIDERVRLVELAVATPGAAGNVGAFVRRPPVAQRSFADALGVVRPAEFAGITAFVVGGSRGLGAVTARLIAAGGGRVVISYVVGEADARTLAAELGEGCCGVIRYDARDEASAQLASIDRPVNHLYYFASAHIHRQKAELFAADRFAEFCDVYVAGFERTVSALRQRDDGPLCAFYPSSSAVGERPRAMTEYAMAKAAGEILCADLARFVPGLHAIVRRLPRVLTDQTATVMPVESDDALEVMLPIVRDMQAMRV